MLRYKTNTRPGLVALYDVRPGNGAGPFLQPRSPHGAPILVHEDLLMIKHKVALSLSFFSRARVCVCVCVHDRAWPRPQKALKLRPSF